MTIIVRAASLGELSMIMDLERAGFDAIEQWSETLWTQELTAADRRLRVAVDDSATVVGVISIQVLPPDSDLMRLVVDPRRRRQGVGSALIADALDLAAREGASAMMLEVRYDNQAAIECYNRAGFEQLTTRPDYYGPGQDAMVMRAWELDRRGVDRG